MTPVRVMVQLNTSTNSAMLSAFSGSGAAVQRQYKHFPKVLVLTVPQGLVKLIASLPFVKYVSPDRVSNKAKLDLTTATVGANVAFQSGLTGNGRGRGGDR